MKRPHRTAEPNAGRSLKSVVRPLFDAGHYRNELRKAGLVRGAFPFGLLHHFLSVGILNGIDPHPLFDTRWYLERHKDVAASGQHAFAHYARYGNEEDRQAHPFFDPEWYLQVYPDLRDGSQSAIKHFLLHGLKEGRDPNPFFASRWYTEHNPDVTARGMPAFLHFLRIGLADGRDPHPMFDTRWYVARYPEVAASGLAPFEHFMRFGVHAGFDPHPLFDAGYCLSRYGTDPGRPAAFSFMAHGRAAGLSPTPLFDPDFYAAQNADVIADDETPFDHFLRRGRFEDRAPNRIFDAAWYRKQAGGDVGPSAFEHFLREGAGRGLDPHPLFDTRWYQRTYHDRLAGEPPFFHYLAHGDLRPNAAFDPDFVEGLIGQCASTLARSQDRDAVGASAGRPASAKRIVFTSIARNYLPHALVLAESVKRFSPDVHFAIVLCDAVLDLDVRGMDNVDEIVTIDAFGPDFDESWIFQHTVVELCTAVKGPAFEAFLRRPGCEDVIYFDPDIWICGDLIPIDRALAEHSAVLTPHLLKPETLDAAVRINEFDALRHGAFNLGFLAVRNDPAGRDVAAWWSARLQRHCFADSRNGLFVDQKWMDLAPGFFPQIGVLWHPGCNVAPWNLSQRRVEGDTYRGFTVDGGPLVFFHFSGHLNGSGAGMLKTFAGDNAAALLLDDLYGRRLAVETAILGEMPPWAFGQYQDGGSVTPDDRRLYRERPDVQAAFPHPFGVRGSASFRTWRRRLETASGDLSELDRLPLPPERTLLERYLEASEDGPVQPCRLFDPAFYLRANADVARAGIDPYVHFLRHGLAEGRRCSAALDLGFYAKQAGGLSTKPEIAFEQAMKAGLVTGVRSVAIYDDVLDRAVVDRWRAALTDNRPIVLMVGHYGGGGTFKNINELMTALAHEAHFLLLMPNLNGTLSLRLVGADEETLVFDRGDVATGLVDVVRGIGVDRVHVHHGFGLERELGPFLAALGRPFDVTLHDTYFLTPNPFFTHDSVARTPAGLRAAIDGGVASPIGQTAASPLTPDEWRRQFAPVLRSAERILAPSRAIAEIYAAFEPDLAIAIVPNLEIDRPGLPLPVPPLLDGVLTIAFAGDLQPHKGSEVFADTAAEARGRQSPLRFVVIGEAPDLGESANVAVTGRYRDEDLPGLLRQHGVHALWLPFRAPESYSYVLTVGLWSGLALAATDAGSLKERLVGIENAHVRPVETSVDSWLDLFETIRRDMMAGTFQARPCPPAADTFYKSRYLDPARKSAEHRTSATRRQDFQQPAIARNSDARTMPV